LSDIIKILFIIHPKFILIQTHRFIYIEVHPFLTKTKLILIECDSKYSEYHPNNENHKYDANNIIKGLGKSYSDFSK